MKIKSLSIFFPSLNDSQILPSLISKANITASNITSNYEITVVNDGSTDNTLEVLEKLKKKYKNLKVVNHKKNSGYGGALISGFKHSTKEWVFYTDGDGQYDPSELLLLMNKLDGKTDVVNGYKLKREDNITRKIIGSTYNLVLHKIYRLPVSDVDCDFRLIRKSLMDQINLNSTSGLICLELILKLKKAGARFKEVGVHHYKRQYGKSVFFNPKNLLKTLIDNTKFYIQYSR